MVKRIIVVKPEARSPLIWEVVKPLALPMFPLQKIMAVEAEVRGTSARANQPTRMLNNIRGINCVTGGLDLATLLVMSRVYLRIVATRSGKILSHEMVSQSLSKNRSRLVFGLRLGCPQP
ncbi:MAG: hypothetical protein QM813_11385 [Verrucomicrobiota bacterium]